MSGTISAVVQGARGVITQLEQVGVVEFSWSGSLPSGTHVFYLAPNPSGWQQMAQSTHSVELGVNQALTIKVISGGQEAESCALGSQTETSAKFIFTLQDGTTQVTIDVVESDTVNIE